MFLQANWDNYFHKKLWNCKLTAEVRIVLNEKITLPKNDELTIKYLSHSLGLRVKKQDSEEDTLLTKTQMNEFNKCKTSCRCITDIQHQQNNYGIRSFCNTCSLIIEKIDSSLNCAGCGKKEKKKLCLHCIRSNFVYRNRMSEKLEMKDKETRYRDERTFRARDRDLEEKEKNQKRRRFS
jgi:hypothetical protein